MSSNFKYGQNLIIDTSVFTDHRYHHKNTIKYNLYILFYNILSQKLLL